MSGFHLLLSAVLLMATTAVARAEVRVTDDVGRDVTLPHPAQGVAPAGPPAEVLLYVVAPDLMAGWARQQPAPVLAALDARAKSLPVLGHLTGWEGEPDYSKWTAAKVDLFVDYGSVNGRFETLADTVQSATAIPYVVFDGRLENTPTALRTLGRLLNREARADEIARAAERILARAAADPRGAKIYIARTADGGDTTSARSQHGEIYNVAGATNVVALDGQATPGQLAIWAPETIIALDPEFTATAKTAPWAGLPAVRKGRVFVAPTGPWSWMGGPPSVNRLLGLVWLHEALADKPDWTAADAEAKALYALLYPKP